MGRDLANSQPEQYLPFVLPAKAGIQSGVGWRLPGFPASRE